MRDRHLLTLEEDILLRQADEYAKKIDEFLLIREQSVLSKLIAIGGASEVESFEVQTKVPVENRKSIIEYLDHPDIDILHKRTTTSSIPISVLTIQKKACCVIGKMNSSMKMGRQ